MPTDGNRPGPTIPHWYTPGESRAEIADASGVTVVDSDGNEYLDFVSALYCVNAGYSNQSIIKAMEEQLNRVQYVSPANDTPIRDSLATRLIDVAPDSLESVLFSVTGSEANELAIQLARKYTDAPKILTRWQSYHGSTYGAGSLTGSGTRNTVQSHASTTGAVKFLPPVRYNSPFPAETPEELAEQAADHLEYVIRKEGPNTVAAVVTESIAGGSGAYTAPPGYFQRVREICDTYDVLLIADEVLTGFGRCGDWFGIQTENVEPDMLTFAKAVTGGYAPLAGVMVDTELTEYLDDEGFGLGQTFGGHPVACAAGVAAIDEYRDGLIENVDILEPVLADRLHQLAEKYAVIDDVRGRGLHWAIAFIDPETGEPIFDPIEAEEEEDSPIKALTDETRKQGAIFSGGRRSQYVLICPPLVATPEDIHTAMDILDGAMETVFTDT